MVTVVTALLRMPMLFEPRWDHDEGVFTTVAWAMSRGFTLYARIYDLQPPGIYWLYWALLHAGGEQSHLVVQVAVSLFAMAAAVLTWVVAGRLVSPWAATLAGCLIGFALAIPVLGGGQLNVELAALPFFLSALALAFSARPIALIGAGALLALALIFRPSFAIDGLALLVPLLSTPNRPARLVLIAAGGIVVLALAAGGLWLQGSWAAFVDIVLPSDRRYLLYGNGNSLAPVAVRALVVTIPGALLFIRSKSLGGRLISVWLPASLAGSTLTPVPYTHYVHEALPPLAIGVAMAVDKARANRGGWLSIPVSALAMVACAEALLVLPEIDTALMRGQTPPSLLSRVSYYESVPRYYSNWLSLVDGAQSRDAYDSWFSDVASRRQELAAIRAAGVPPGSNLLVIGSDSWLYYEGGFDPATPWMQMWVGEWLIPNADDVIDPEIKGGCIDVVVVDNSVSKFHPEDLTAGGYVPVAGAPWPAYRSVQRAPSCGITA